MFSIQKHIDRLCRQSKKPEFEEALEAWTGLDGIVDLVRADVGQDEIVVYVNLGNAPTFMHAVMVPVSSLDEVEIKDMASWTLNPSDSWSIWGTSTIKPPLSGDCPEETEQLVFVREFEGRTEEEKTYAEILQKITHLFGLHQVDERNAYCRFDRNGDVEEVIRTFRFNKKDDGFSGIAVTFKRTILDDYMHFTNSVLIRQFEIHHFEPDEFAGYGRGGEEAEHGIPELIYYRTFVAGAYAGYMQGAQIIRPSGSLDDAIRRLNGTEEYPKYASFIVRELKGGEVREVSCAPGATSSSFMKSDLPDEMSPAFFRAEVLSKYRADPDKYEILHDRYISCRGVWVLRCYDTNEQDQVHTYLRYLRDLPYDEQIYWRSMNESPKGDISRRALTTDFKGMRFTEYDPLDSLRALLAKQDLCWWTLRSERLLRQVHYPAGDSAKEWGNAITQLDQFLVEGLEEKWLRKQAKALGCTEADRLRSLKLLEKCLIGLGLGEEHAREVTGPLHTLHNFRSEVGGSHASGSKAAATRKKVLAGHGTYRAHFRGLCAECHEALKVIIKEFGELC